MSAYADPVVDDEEDGKDPGPRKTFWEHVEDLRKVLVRSSIAIGIAFVACLLLDDKLVKIIEYPLKNMDAFVKPKPTVTIQMGAKNFGPFDVPADQFPGVNAANPNGVFRFGTVRVGEEDVLTLKAVPAAELNEKEARVRLHNIGPAEGFLVAFQIAIYAGIIVASPFWVYFLGQFLLPALHVHEKRVLFTWLGWGTFLFLSGVALTYFVLLPLALHASMTYSEMLGFEATLWRADDYISFVTKFVLGMGIGFQFPVVILILVKMGLLTHHTLARYRRHVCVLCFVLGAVLTTPEVITQVAMAVPLYILYEASILIAWYWDRKKRKLEAAA